MKKIEYLPRPTIYSNPDEFLAVINNVTDENSLFKELSQKLNFPGYFGENWNALNDLLRDFHWIKQKGIVIIHETIPELELVQLKIYLEILKLSVFDWKPNEEHYLKVIFPKSNKIKDLVDKIQVID